MYNQEKCVFHELISYSGDISIDNNHICMPPYILAGHRMGVNMGFSNFTTFWKLTGKNSISALLGLTAAFDTVDRTVMLERLVKCVELSGTVLS